MTGRRIARRLRKRRVSFNHPYGIGPSPEGIRFGKGCVIGLPLSAVLWWLILEAAKAMI